MSTRANVILKEGNEKLFFYRHSDGYPEGVKPSLDKFCEGLKKGTIRNNLLQSAGWLIMLGAAEYDTKMEYDKEESRLGIAYGDISTAEFPGWKVGAYEPTTGIHGDVEHVYLVDVEKGTWDEVPAQKEVKKLYPI